MPSREQFLPDLPRILLHWNWFVKRSSPKFLLTVVQVWSATTENVWLRLLLPKECQLVFKSKGSHSFPPCTVNVYAVCSIKTWKRVIVCVLLVEADCVRLLLWLRWRSDSILWPIYAEIQVIPKGSHNFSCHCMYILYFIPSIASCLCRSVIAHPYIYMYSIYFLFHSFA